MFKTKHGAVFSLALTFLVSALAPGWAASPVTIDVVIPLSGNAAFLGHGEQVALQVLEKATNADGGIAGRPLHFNFLDDQTSPQTAVQLMSKILASNPPVVLGSNPLATCNAMAALITDGPVEYCFSPIIDFPAGSYIFSASTSEMALMAALIRYDRMRGWKRIAVIVTTDATGYAGLRDIKEVLKRSENKDVELVAAETFNGNAISVSAQLQLIKDAHPDTLIAYSTGAPIALVLRGLQDAGIDVPVATSGGNMTFAQMSAYRTFLPKNLYFPTAEWVVSSSAEDRKIHLPEGVVKAKEFLAAAYQAAGEKLPDAVANYSWDPAKIVVDALRKLGPDTTAEQLRNYIAHLQNYAGIDGVYDFQKSPQRGLSDDAVVMTRWSPEKNNWVIVSEPGGAPADVATAK